MALTDGAGRSSQVDPGNQSTDWDALLNDGVASTGVDPAVPFDASDDPASTTPQSASSGTSDGTDNGSPNAPADVTTGDDGQAKTPDPAADTDPLATAKPFTYTIDGQERVIEGTFRIPGEGLVIPEDRVQHFELMASRAETLDRQNRELYDSNQKWDRLTAWQTRDEQGNVVTQSGPPAYEAQRVLLGRTIAALKTITDAFATDEAFAELIGVTGEPGQEMVVRSPKAIALLKERMDNAAYRAEQTVRSSLSKAGVVPTPEPAASDFAKPTIAKLIADHQITGLTPADQEFLAAEFPRYVVQDGKALDPRFLEVMKDRAGLRAEQIKVTTAATTAGKFNGAMTSGRAPAKALRQAAPAPPATPAAKVGKAAQWDNILQSALSEIQLP